MLINSLNDNTFLTNVRIERMVISFKSIPFFHKERNGNEPPFENIIRLVFIFCTSTVCVIDAPPQLDTDSFSNSA
jgi:hypothetical protein